MTLDDIRKFAHSNPEDFAEYLLADGWRWSNPAAAAHFERKYAQTLRDQFAIAALPDCLAQEYNLDWGERGDQHARSSALSAYQIADAMMAVRETFLK